MRMPFGMHRNREIADVPAEYLAWVRDQEWLSDWLKRVIDEEMELRREMERLRRLGPQVGGLRIEPGEARFVREMIDLGHRALALRCHPSTQKKLNNVVARLRVQLEQMESAS